MIFRYSIQHYKIKPSTKLDLNPIQQKTKPLSNPTPNTYQIGLSAGDGFLLGGDGGVITQRFGGVFALEGVQRSRPERLLAGGLEHLDIPPPAFDVVLLGLFGDGQCAHASVLAASLVLDSQTVDVFIGL